MSALATPQDQMKIQEAKTEAVHNAIDSLARYKFMMFGYWSAIWVHLNQIDDNKEPNPFRFLVQHARHQQHGVPHPTLEEEPHEVPSPD